MTDSRALAFQTLKRLGVYSVPTAADPVVNNAMSVCEPAEDPVRELACPHLNPGHGWFLTSGRVVCAACFKERRRREGRQGTLFASIADLKAFAAEQRRRRRQRTGEPEDDD